MKLILNPIKLDLRVFMRYDYYFINTKTSSLKDPLFLV